jgi:hypothetical protein
MSLGRVLERKTGYRQTLTKYAPKYIIIYCDECCEGELESNWIWYLISWQMNDRY